MRNEKDLDDSFDFYDNSVKDDEIEDDASDYEGSFQWDAFNYSIRGTVTNTDLETIVNGLGDGTINVPGFQRKFVWTREQVADLALSIVKGIPIPPIYVYFDTVDGNEFILDGQQRVTALFLFFYGLYFHNENIRKRIDYEKVSGIMRSLSQIEEDIKGGSPDDQRNLKRKKKELTDTLKNEYGLEETEFFVKDHAGNQHDVTFGHYQERERRILKRKALQYAVVECANGDSPQEFYTMVFKMLNSGGKNIGAQEIRNGLYWKTPLYKGLVEINEDETLPWRNIYGRISLYSKDIEMLLKMMALNHYTKLVHANNETRIDIEFQGTFNWGNIMGSYSRESSKWDSEEVSAELKKVRYFLKHIKLDDKPKLCRKATLEAVYVCLNKIGLLDKLVDDELSEMDIDIEMSWLVELSKDKSIFGEGKVLSNKDSVQKRLTSTLPRVRERYEYN